jgi:hypothetical protein
MSTSVALVARARERRLTMELHRGRLIDHIQLRCADLVASKRFYAAVLAIFGRELKPKLPPPSSAPERS